jgi:glycyl-tRNA synthetase beta chain
VTKKTSPRQAETLLVELGTEELPPKSLASLGEAFARNLHDYLVNAAWVESGQEPGYEWYATPRRLAVRVFHVRNKQPGQHVERRGPSVAAAFDEHGNPTPAAVGFAGSCGTTVEKLGTIETSKGVWLVYNHRQKGESLGKLITAGLEHTVKQLPIRKRMRWGDGDAEFVRPVHWLVVLHGKRRVNAVLLSLKAGDHTRGHRFHADREIPIPHADKYVQTLRTRGRVIVDFTVRRRMILDQVDELAGSVKGRVTPDDALVDEVTGLVEWPYGLLGSFDKGFLDIPQECLVSSMRDHQKYFHLVNRNGRLLPNFITISNIDSKSPARVQDGNQRVLRARLSDARFFWETDLKMSLVSRRPQLEFVLFHVELGSILDKTRRLEQLAKVIADRIDADIKLAGRAALLSKSDLVSGMVGEFPELQGVMGRYYASLDDEEEAVAIAIEQHYWPRYAGDRIPESGVSQAVALADKLDTLTGIFNTGEEPTGEKDPYGLRRAALGVLRTIIEARLDIDLADLLRSSAASYNDTNGIKISNEATSKLLDFMLDRLQSTYVAEGFGVDEIRSVLACRPTRPLEFDQRLRAVTSFRELPESDDLSAANKRITNILRKAGVKPANVVSQELLSEDAERALLGELERLERDVDKQFQERNFETGLKLLAGLRDPVDKFFDEVMVMTEDKATRKNRLALLSKLQALFLRVADISELQKHRG